MGVPWHKERSSERREWVVYVAALFVLVLIGGGIAAGVIFAGRARDSAQQAAAQAAAPAAAIDDAISSPSPPVASPPPPPLPPLPTPPPPPSPRRRRRPPPPAEAANAPASAPDAGEPAASSPSPSTPAGGDSTPSPSQPAAAPAPAPGKKGRIPSTFDPNAAAVRGTLDGPPPGVTVPPNFKPVEVPAELKGTCATSTDKPYRCFDDMDYGATQTVPQESLMVVEDPQRIEECGWVDLSQVVSGLVGWAYKKKCGIASFTTTRACVGQPGVADGAWRARVMLWPLPGGDPEMCKPLCIKMRGRANTVTDYGRTGTC